jgi:hypothetical protein
MSMKFWKSGQVEVLVSVLLELPIAVVERADLTSLQPPVKKYDNKLIRNISKEIRVRHLTKLNKIQ